MNAPIAPPQRAARTNAEYRWTRPRIVAFLDALASSGSVAEAARVVGVSRQSAYRLRARLGPGFAEIWDEGLALAACRRALQGDRSRRKVTPQGDTRPVQSDTSPPQGDTFAPQGDTLQGQGDTLGPQGDTFSPWTV